MDLYSYTKTFYTDRIDGLPGEHHFVCAFVIPLMQTKLGDNWWPEYINPDGMKSGMKIYGDIIWKEKKTWKSIEVKYGNSYCTENQKIIFFGTNNELPPPPGVFVFYDGVTLLVCDLKAYRYAEENIGNVPKGLGNKKRPSKMGAILADQKKRKFNFHWFRATDEKFSNMDSELKEYDESQLRTFLLQK